MNRAMQYPIVDGFLYNTALRPDASYLAMVLAEYEALRLARAYRTRWLTIPEDPAAISIPAYDSYEYQAFATPGSVYWGWIFTPYTFAAVYSVTVTDGCTDVPLFSEVLSVAPSGTTNPGQGKQNLLPRLLVVGQPGVLNIQICSLDATADNNVQFCLCGAEPVPQEHCCGDR